MRFYRFVTWVIIAGVILLSVAESNAQWQPQYSSVQNDLFGVHFIDNNQGVAVGKKATIIRTTNGGSEWTVVQKGSLTDYAYKDVAYIDDQTGFIVGYKGTGYIIRKTNDGLNGWFDKKSGANNGLYDISFSSQNNNGVAVGDGGLIVLTKDGGNSFNEVNFGENLNLYGVDVIGDVIYTVGQSGAIFKSNDMGNSWTQQIAPPSQDLHNVHFVDEDTGYAAGEAGVIVKTVDGGQNWATLNGSTSNDLNDIFFVTEKSGFVVGDKGVIASTNDEGSTWNNAINGGNFKATLHALHFPSTDVGFTVGNVDDFNTTEGMVKKYSTDTRVRQSANEDSHLHLSKTSTDEQALLFKADQNMNPPFRITFLSIDGKNIAKTIVRERQTQLKHPSPVGHLLFYSIATNKGIVKTGKLLLR